MAKAEKPTAGLPSTRDRILEAARDLIVAQGIGGLRIRELARAVGIREGSIYNHFEGREAIIRELFQDLDLSLSPFGAILSLATASEEELRDLGVELTAQGFSGFLRETKKYIIEGLERRRSTLQLIRAILSARFHDAAALRAYEEVFRKDVAGVFEAICAIAQKQGLIKPGLRSEIVAELLVAVFEQSLQRCYADEGLERFERILGDQFEAIAAMAMA